jgi:hypothetical protein
MSSPILAFGALELHLPSGRSGAFPKTVRTEDLGGETIAAP